ncbi:MAG: sensor histidine kinase [Myxococcales bacterium]|nr:sensor histidine kinase [Myxococcales bacterium]
MNPSYDLRARTLLVCGALAIAIAVSALLRSRIERRHALFAAFAGDAGLWYLSQSLAFVREGLVPERVRILLPIFLPALAANLFEAMVKSEDPAHGDARVGKRAALLALPVLGLAASPYVDRLLVRVGLFGYAALVFALALRELHLRGHNSRSRDTRRRVRFLVLIGSLAGLFTVAEFGWVIGSDRTGQAPPIGVVLTLVLLVVLAHALRHERLLDWYELLGRLLVATLVAFLIAGIFYVLVAFVGQFYTMWLNAIVIAIVVLVLFNPLRDWTEDRIQRFVLRERGRLEACIAEARRTLAHTLDLDEMGAVVVRALERSRSVTEAALYLLVDDGTVFERHVTIGSKSPSRIDVAAASALLEQLYHAPVVLEQLARDLREGRPEPRRHVASEAVLAAAEVLATLRHFAVVFGVRGEEGELVGLLVVGDERIGDAFSPEDVALFEQLAAQIGVVLVSSRIYVKMRARDRLAVLGQMAAGIAHEIRNPLGAIKGAAQLLAEPGQGGPELEPSAREFVGIILEEVERLDGVVGSVLNLARENPVAVAPIDVNAVVRRTLQLLSTEWNDGRLAVDESLADELPRVAIAPEELRQVMMNILRNAAQAVSGAGRITVRTRARQGARPKVAGVVVITVTDDGPGIAAHILKQVFLPFFTTKEGGTGLGLAISQRIVQEAGGRIEVRSREGEGTTFNVVMPAAMDPLGTPVPAVVVSVG